MTSEENMARLNAAMERQKKWDEELPDDVRKSMKKSIAEYYKAYCMRIVGELFPREEKD